MARPDLRITRLSAVLVGCFILAAVWTPPVRANDILGKINRVEQRLGDAVLRRVTAQAPDGEDLTPGDFVGPNERLYFYHAVVILDLCFQPKRFDAMKDVKTFTTPPNCVDLTQPPRTPDVKGGAIVLFRGQTLTQFAAYTGSGPAGLHLNVNYVAESHIDGGTILTERNLRLDFMTGVGGIRSQVNGEVGGSGPGTTPDVQPDLRLLEGPGSRMGMWQRG
jgi:hypothetical protein